MSWLDRVVAPVAILAAAGAFCAGCSLGEGTGSVKSDNLNAPGCWIGAFDLQPDFFAAVPFRDSLNIRVQRGSDYEEFSDGIMVLIDSDSDTRKKLGKPLSVTLPIGVAPPGVPPGELCGPDCSDDGIHLAFFLLHSCHQGNTVLYGISGTMTFTTLFDDNQNESDAEQKLTEAKFDIMVGDPHAYIISGKGAGTIPNQSHLTGSYRFYFERGQPAQPFP